MKGIQFWFTFCYLITLKKEQKKKRMKKQSRTTDRHLFYYTSDILQKHIGFQLESHKAAIIMLAELKVLSISPNH